jgi:D-alanyl-lipoteichoic acid acyltransferase DltB (MBOAT superfamily)
MLFNSYAFIFLYLPLVLVGYFLLAKKEHSHGILWLTLASIFFYAYWSYLYVFLLLASVVFNFLMGSLICSFAEKNKKNSLLFLQIAIAVNLLLLGYYKYSNFFIDIFTTSIGTKIHSVEFFLPLGISFFTFTQIAFLVDTYRGIAKEHNFIKYLLFVTYFPHLIAGPVLHHKQMMPQFSDSTFRHLNWENISNGLIIFCIGLSKKLIFADALAPYVDAIFDASANGVQLTAYEAWAGALGYTFQLYFDFSGYSDMAIGISLMLNIHLPINFNQPYKSTSIIDFWRRWHMSLSQFLRDYLYIPLGGNKNGAFARYFNLFVTMVLGGLWHGAGLTFVLWGALHGVFLIINHFWRQLVRIDQTQWFFRLVQLAFGWFLTFMSIVIAWVIFRSETIDSAQSVLSSMFGIENRQISFKEVTSGNFVLVTQASGRDFFRLLLLSFLAIWIYPYIERIRVKSFPSVFVYFAAIVIGLIYLMIINKFGQYSPFLYFQF